VAQGLLRLLSKKQEDRPSGVKKSLQHRTELTVHSRPRKCRQLRKFRKLKEL
jgi:hypothetical protein